jgi:hypothetical protein
VSWSPVPSVEAAEIAKWSAPVVLQGLTIKNGKPDPRDNIQRIYFDDFDETIGPAGYYAVKCKGRYLAVYWHYFGRHDWSEGQFGGPLRDALDSHDGDFEGLVTIYEGRKALWTASRAHYHFNVYRHTTERPPLVYRETMGHSLFCLSSIEGPRPYLSCQDYPHLNMLEPPHSDDVRRLPEHFHVDRPQEVDDWRLSKDRRTMALPECLYWSSPDRLIDALVTKLHVLVKLV